jgi:hypothetical protein
VEIRWQSSLRRLLPFQTTVDDAPYFVAEESKGLVPWPRQQPIAPWVAFSGGILGAAMVALAILAEPGPVPRVVFVAAGTAVLIVPILFLLKPQPLPPLVFDREGMLTPGGAYIYWRDVAKLTYDIGVVATRRPPHFAWLLTVSKIDGSEVEFCPPPLDADNHEIFMSILEDLSRQHRFHLRYPRR